MNESTLLKLKKTIEQAEKELNELSGEKKVLLKTLKDDFNCGSPKEAKARIKKIQEELEDLESRKQEIIKELEEKYEFE